ncbi:E3 SUMO- ligase KIAA1586-like isoform X2, partial [Paramuricea clavata]
MKLDVDWLLDAAKCLVLKKEIKDKRKRPTVTCLLCNKYEFQVRKMTSNCQLPIANGVRVDGKDRLKHVVDHLLSPAHEEAERLNDCDKTWCDKSDKHPWVQIDGSADKQQVDSKFITARYVPCDEVSVKTVFLGIASSDLGGAEGLLDSFTTCIENIGINTAKLVGVTTDGENANTGKNAGLWKLLQDYIGRDILTIWCVCHRSDLALESVQAEVPELTIWMSNVLAVATFFRTSPRRTKLLHKVEEKCLSFPKHFDVRFSEHTRNLLNAVLHNLDAARRVWQDMVDGTIESNSKEKQMAKGFIEKWYKGSRQVWLTAVMFDLCTIFKTLQKLFQKSNLILPDVLTAKDSAMQNLKIMNDIPVPGGKEEQNLELHDNEQGRP